MICGVDEAGRGPLAGPVVAAAVILPAQGAPIGVADSKTLSAQARMRLATAIQECALVGVGVSSVEEIDRLNIRMATHLAMRRAVEALPALAQLALVDGIDAPALPCPARAIIGGDGLEPAIAAASIIAKTTRDAMMTALCDAHPGYGFAKHKGYGTAAHLAALRLLGPCQEHRRSFAPVRAAANGR